MHPSNHKGGVKIQGDSSGPSSQARLDGPPGPVTKVPVPSGLNRANTILDGDRRQVSTVLLYSAPVEGMIQFGLKGASGPAGRVKPTFISSC